jgi:hypothetical protein
MILVNHFEANTSCEVRFPFLFGCKEIVYQPLFFHKRQRRGKLEGALDSEEKGELRRMLKRVA